MSKAIGAGTGSQPSPQKSQPSGARPGPGMTSPSDAPGLLAKAAEHMAQRAATYDKPAGERSMGKAVEAFNAITGMQLCESEGWLLMICLKLVRDNQRMDPHRDSIEDAVAYTSLYGESRLNLR